MTTPDWMPKPAIASFLFRHNDGRTTAYITHEECAKREREAARAALEQAALVCNAYSIDKWSMYKGRPPHTGRADPHTQGESDGASNCADAIRAHLARAQQAEPVDDAWANVSREVAPAPDAWMGWQQHPWGASLGRVRTLSFVQGEGEDETPLYAAPPSPDKQAEPVAWHRDGYEPCSAKLKAAHGGMENWITPLYAAPPSPQVPDDAVEICRLRNVIQAACVGGLDHMIARWKELFPDAPVPTFHPAGPVALHSIELVRDVYGMCIVKVNGREAIRDNGDVISHFATLDWFAAKPAQVPAPLTDAQIDQIAAFNLGDYREGEWHRLFARAILAEAACTPPGWQPIETAPKDGTEILMTNGVDVSSGSWFDGYDGSCDSDGAPNGDEQDAQWMDWGGGMQPDPTLWMPLPAAPMAGKGES